MTTEVTASLMIGPVSPDSAHGKPSLTLAEKWFCPSHVMVLMEGARATWLVPRCPSLGRPTLASHIHPSSPEHLLAAGVLGYTALTARSALNRSDKLCNAVVPTPSNRGLRIGPIDRELAAHVFAMCGEFIDGAITVLPGSSITDDELQIAAGCGLRVAIAASTVGGPSAEVPE
jgi:hypothetical protein